MEKYYWYTFYETFDLYVPLDSDKIRDKCITTEKGAADRCLWLYDLREKPDTIIYYIRGCEVV